MRKFLLIILLVGLTPLLLAQETVYFPSFETINVHHKHQYVTSKLFKNYVDANGKYQIILPSELKHQNEINQSYNETNTETRANALNHQAAYYIIADMSAIGNLLIVNMTMYNASSGKMVWSDALKADELEDLDPVIRLLANALGSETPAGDSGDIYSVTQYNSKELNRREANESWGMTIGGGALLGSGIKDPALSGFGIVLSYDVRDLILDLKAELYFGENNTNARRLGINLLKPLSDKDFSMFYGGGFYYGGISYDKDKVNTNTTHWDTYGSPYTNSGIELEGNFGVLLNRLSSIQLRAMISPTIALYKIDNKAVGSIRFGVTATF